MPCASHHYLFYVIPISDLQQDMIDGAIQSGGATLRTNAAGTDVMLKFCCADVPVSVTKLGITVQTYSEARATLLGAGWGVE
jgi:hypothetical protein